MGLLVLAGLATLAALILTMSGTNSLFSRSIYLKTRLANAGTLRVGAPVRLQGVDIGYVVKIAYDPANRQALAVEVTMKVDTTYESSLRKDTKAAMTNTGVLGEAFMDLDSSKATGDIAKSGDVLQSEDRPGIDNVMKASQGSLEKLDVVLVKMDSIVTSIEQGKGSVGMAINDPQLFNRANKMLIDLQKVVEAVTSGQGSIGKLLNSNELYDKVNTSVDKLSRIVDDINAGKGNAGKFLKDEALYRNANETLAKANRLVGEIEQGRGALGKMAKDQEFAKKIDNIVAKISLLTDRLEAGEGSVGKLLKDPSLYTNADQLLVEMRSLVKAIREKPKKYLTIHLKIF